MVSRIKVVTLQKKGFLASFALKSEGWPRLNVRYCNIMQAMSRLSIALQPPHFVSG